MAREKAIKARTRVTTKHLTSSTKSAKPIRTESMWEYICILLIEFSTHIVEVTPQPETLTLTVDDRSFRYTPDILIKREDGTETYLEIKDYRYTRKPDAVERLELIRRGMEQKGKELRIYTDDQLTSNRDLITNLTHLKRYRSPVVRRTSPVNEAMIPPLPTTVGKLMHLLDFHYAYRLIAENLVWCDLTKPLRDTTVVEEFEGRSHEFID